MVRILIIGALIVAALVVIKDHHVLQRSGVIGYCERVPTPAGQDGDWHACHKGWLTGRPDLSQQSCTDAGLAGTVEYWRCDAPVIGVPGL